ncbi:hypothetical protein PIB30_069008 [Stylosanthes scabra]|uniref:Uncharacterized protein n=1 Tax=Stylosanthes scabra TaxID=79078 RepID=A0ABU6WLG9_9FABA|nr:hypothetical protein [Stylosanthes scabra]
MSPRTGPNAELGVGADGMRSRMRAAAGPSVAEDEQSGESTAVGLKVCDRVSDVKTPAGENNACTMGAASVGTSAGRERSEVMHACTADVAMDACTAGEAMDAGTAVVMVDNTENLAQADLDHNVAELAAPACIPSHRRNVRRQILVQADPSSVRRT